MNALRRAFAKTIGVSRQQYRPKWARQWVGEPPWRMLGLHVLVMYANAAAVLGGAMRLQKGTDRLSEK